MPRDGKRLVFDAPIDRQWRSNSHRIARDGPVAATFEGLPIGTGRMGTMVWTLPDRVCMNVNRVDVYPMTRCCGLSTPGHPTGTRRSSSAPGVDSS